MRRRGPSLFKKTATLALLTGSCIWAVSLASVVLCGTRDTAQRADAIVVLGAAQYAGRPSPVLRARLEHAMVLWRRHLASRMVLTGGTGEGDSTSEAAVSRRFVVEQGVPEDAIWLEANGRTTAESLQAVAAMLRAEQASRAILVSDPFHMLRLSILARRYGLIPLLSPTRTSPISDHWKERWAYRMSESVKVPLALIGNLAGFR